MRLGNQIGVTHIRPIDLQLAIRERFDFMPQIGGTLTGRYLV